MSRFAISLRLGTSVILVISDRGLRIAEFQSAFRNPHSAMSCLFRSLRSVLRSALHAPLNADRVERAADDVITDARQVLHAAAPNEHQRVFLQVVAHAGNISRHLDAVRQADARHLAQRGVRLLGRLREDANADTTFLRAVLQGRTFRFADDFLPSGTNELTDGGHIRSRIAEFGVRIAERNPGRAEQSALRTAQSAMFSHCSRPESPAAWRLKTLLALGSS